MSDKRMKDAADAKKAESELSEMYDSIKAIKGEYYAELLAHVVRTNNCMFLLEKNLMYDLEEALKDAEVDTEVKEKLVKGVFDKCASVVASTVNIVAINLCFADGLKQAETHVISQEKREAAIREALPKYLDEIKKDAQTIFKKMDEYKALMIF